MAAVYNPQLIHELEGIFRGQKISRPFRALRYESGAKRDYELTGIFPAVKTLAGIEIERFVGGGYAGQVYKVKMIDLESGGGFIEGIQRGNSYAMKILVPPGPFSRWFRNALYAVAFQGPFSHQVNPDAVRAGALWQRFIRRGAKIRLGSERCVVDVLATFIDPVLGSCGEISEWIEGRAWRFEVDDRLFERLKWKPGDPDDRLGSREYRAKREFMSRIVRLMHDMGAFELARQYEWWTLKSQPNVLQRCGNGRDSGNGLVAVDFRAGLALLPFLPQCPGDLKLIWQGIKRGSPVQFDRGDTAKLERFIRDHSREFDRDGPAFEELRQTDRAYRESLPDIAHHHFRLLYSRNLWISILNNLVRSWKVRGLIDDAAFEKIKTKKWIVFFLTLLGLIPVLGPFLRKIMGNSHFRKHYGGLLKSAGYLKRACRARMAETLIRWHRKGRVGEGKVRKMLRSPWRFYAHIPLALLPPGLHRFLSDGRFARQSLDRLFIRPFRLYFKREAREEWLLETVSLGKEKGMLTPDEAARVRAQIKEPFIQKYLKSLAVHVCTLPVTQIVSISIAFLYVRLHPEMTWSQATMAVGIILGLFQITPISPGSLVRGLYVAYLVIREHNFKDYRVAFSLSFFKYIGYLAFPIQMAYRYPALARFMAGHWATQAVKIIPVFGERGAWLEHAVFDLFYNLPLSVRRRLRRWEEIRAGQKLWLWPIPLVVLAAVGILAAMDAVYFEIYDRIPSLGRMWGIAILVALLTGYAAAVWSRGGRLSRKLAMGLCAGILVAFLHSLAALALQRLLVSVPGQVQQGISLSGRFWASAWWEMSLFALAALAGAFFPQLRNPDPGPD